MKTTPKQPSTKRPAPVSDDPAEYAVICRRVGYAHIVPVDDQDAAGEALLRGMLRAHREMSAREARRAK